MTKEEAEKYIKFKMCNACGVYLGGGKCSDNCKVIEAIDSLEQDIVPFDFELYQQGLMNMPKGMIELLDKIRAEIEQAADNQFQIAMGVSDLNERYAHIQMENSYRHSLNIIDKYKAGGSEG